MLRADAPPLFILLLLLLCLVPALMADESSLQGHMEAFGKQGPSHSIDQVDGFLPPEKFIVDYVQANRPILFKQAATLSPAFNKWTDKYLMGRTPPRPAGDIFIEHNKKENRSSSYNFIHFKKFLEIYNTSNIYMVSDVPDYLLEDLVLPFSLQCKNFLRGDLDTHVVWFSSGGTSSVIHNDSYENINCLYRGRKSLVFLNTTKYKEEVEKIIDKQDGSFSSADVDKIDLMSRPEFRDLEFHVAEMNAGDCLYIPLYWVHQVRSFENNLAVNIWWPPKKQFQLDVCSKEYNTNIHFGKVYFRMLEQAVKSDVDFNRRIIETGVPGNKTKAALLTFLARGNADVAARLDFEAAVGDLFKSIDMDADGALSIAELRTNLKRKQFRPIYRAIANYNVLVFRMHEEEGEGAAAAGLPKLLKTSNSDEGVFAKERTWQETEDSQDVDEMEEDQGPELGADEAAPDAKEAGSDKKKKDEL